MTEPNPLIRSSLLSGAISLPNADEVEDVIKRAKRLTSATPTNYQLNTYYPNPSVLNTQQNFFLDGPDSSIRLLTEMYRDRARDAFINGLNGDLPRLLGVREPNDLPHALHLCEILENQTRFSPHNRYNKYGTPLPPKPRESRNASNRQPENPAPTYGRYDQQQQPRYTSSQPQLKAYEKPFFKFCKFPQKLVLGISWPY